MRTAKTRTERRGTKHLEPVNFLSQAVAALANDARRQPLGGASTAGLSVPSAAGLSLAPGTFASTGSRRGVRLVPGCAGDHPAVHQLLTAVFHAPSREAFYSSLDDPFYEPRDRLLVKRGERIVSHLHLTRRVMRFGALSVPVCGLSWLCTLPEFRGSGYARQLLRCADRAMAADGAMLGLLSTKLPHFFRPQGWAVCGRQSQAQAGSRDVLAQLSALGFPAQEGALNIRPLRQVELSWIIRLYNRATSSASGPFERSEAYWRWLVSRGALNQVLIAMDGPDRLEHDGNGSPIVAYAAVRGKAIVELVADPAYPQAAEQLLARACGEAIERDDHTIVLHAPPGERLFGLFQAAGGTLYQTEAHHGEVFMVKLLDPPAFLRSLLGELHARAEAAGLSRPCELGLSADEWKFRIVLSRRGARLSRNKLSHNCLRLNQAELTRLLLGHLDLDEAVAGGRLAASTGQALDIGKVLFPRLPLWRPPLDDLVA